MTPDQQAAFMRALAFATMDAEERGASTAAIAQVMADWVRMYAAENGDTIATKEGE